MTFGERILKIRTEKGLTQDELANAVGYKSRSTIAKIEAGERDAPQTMIVALAKALGTTPSYLMGWDEIEETLDFLDTITDPERTSEQVKEKDAKTRAKIAEQRALELRNLQESFNNIKPIQLKRFPLLGDIACGEPIFADEDKESFIMADMDIQADFCLTAKGDSMINARINNGDIVFIKKMSMVENGDIAAVIIDNEATLKRVYYYPEKNKLMLVAENPAFEPLVYINEELDTIHILGKAVYFMSAL